MRNYLINCLSEEKKDWLRSHCRVVELKAGNLLCHSGVFAEYVYFPMSTVIATTVELNENESICVGLIGNEGMWGANSIAGNGLSSLSSSVLISGKAMGINASSFHENVDDSFELQKLIYSYHHLLASQNCRTAACSCLHEVRQRLCRWLLMISDRVHSNQFYITHEMLAELLSIRRSTVTITANKLQKEGFIRYRRGKIEIIHRTKLEKASCYCYENEHLSHNDFLKHHAIWRYGNQRMNKGMFIN